jgi:prevent-host-death family protein
MMKVSSAEFERNVSLYQDVAQTQPVTIMRDGREGAVMISAAEYRRLKLRDRRVLGLDDFDHADLAAIRASKPPPDTAQYDHEVT